MRARTVIIDSPRRREQLAAVAERLPAHVARLSYSQDQIKAERQRALRETLAFAKAKSPWHAKRLSGVDAEYVMSNWDCSDSRVDGFHTFGRQGSQ
jgi:hypothetical protein